VRRDIDQRRDITARLDGAGGVLDRLDPEKQKAQREDHLPDPVAARALGELKQRDPDEDQHRGVLVNVQRDELDGDGQADVGRVGAHLALDQRTARSGAGRADSGPLGHRPPPRQHPPSDPGRGTAYRRQGQELTRVPQA